MARRSSGKGNSKSPPVIDREQKILGVLLISLSLLVGLGLLQNQAGEFAEGGGHRINRIISQSLITFFGLGAWAVPFLLIHFGWNRVVGSTLREAGRVFLTALAGLITWSLLSFSTGIFHDSFQYKAGGMLGNALFSLANRNFGSIGSSLIAITFLLVVLIWLYDIAIPRWNFGGVKNALRPLPGSIMSGMRKMREQTIRVYEAIVDELRDRFGGERAAVEEDEEEEWYEEEDEGEHEEEEDEEGDDDDGEDAIEVVESDEEGEEDLPPGPPQIVKPALAKKAHPSRKLKRPDTPPGEKEYLFPPLSLLDDVGDNEPVVEEAYLLEQSSRLEQRLGDFGVRAKVIEVHPGPVITRFELEPAPGVKVQQIANLADDLALVMRAKRIRIVAPIPGKGAVGIEIPNPKSRTVYLQEVLTSTEFEEETSKLAVALGKDISGHPFCCNLEGMPHLLLAGATGAGKSVSLHVILMSLLFGASPEEVHLLLIDPKMLEMTMYNGIPHLLAPVVTDAKEAARVLRWAVFEMERRYKLLARVGVRSIGEYNTNLEKLKASQEIREEGLILEPLPFLVIVIDEFADLILTAPAEIEDSVARLAQMARAVGIHLVLATQRPSVNVITGVIKANFPSRIAFQVASKIDSRTILDANGAEKLLGKGDMLFVFAGRPEVNRVHGALITTEEASNVLMFLKEQGYQPKNRATVILPDDPDTGSGGRSGGDGNLSPLGDDLFDEAARIVIRSGQGSVSLLQRRLRVGYSRAARLVDLLEQADIVGPFEGSKAREVLVDEEWLRIKEQEAENDDLSAP